MESKLYNAAYLEQTANLLKEIKQLSYESFLTLEEGTIADVGCGTGQDVNNLSRLVKPSVQLVGLDADAEMIAIAKAENNTIENVNFDIAIAEQLPFEDGQLSGLRNERLIQHLKQPELAFAEFARVLKPKAPLTIVETDWSSFCLYSAPTGLAERVRDFYAHNNVAFGAAALNLSHWMHESGLGEIKLKVFPIVTQSLAQVIAFTRLNFVLNKMLEEDAISQQELELLNQYLVIADNQGYFGASLNMIVATSVKKS